MLSIKTKAIRETEIRNMSQGGSRHARNTPRDLDSFRRGLKELQDQVEQVESLKHSYYLQVANGERQVWNKVSDSVRIISYISHSTRRALTCLSYIHTYIYIYIYIYIYTVNKRSAWCSNQKWRCTIGSPPSRILIPPWKPW
jgi:hypothetical protein